MCRWMSQRLDGSCREYKLFIYNFSRPTFADSGHYKMSTYSPLDDKLGPHLHQERDALGTHAKEPRVVVLDRRASA